MKAEELKAIRADLAVLKRIKRWAVFVLGVEALIAENRWLTKALGDAREKVDELEDEYGPKSGEPQGPIIAMGGSIVEHGRGQPYHVSG